MPGILDFLNLLTQQKQGMLAQNQGMQQQPQGLLNQPQPQGNFLQGLSRALIASDQPQMYKQSPTATILGALNAGVSGDASSFERQAMMNNPNFAKMGSTTPSSVQEYQYYNNLTPAEKENYLRVKRASQIIDLGGSKNVLNPTGPGLSQTFEKTLKPEDVPANAAAKKYAEEQGGQNAKADSAATSTLPVIDQLRTFNSGTFSMPYADTAPVRGYTRIFGDEQQQGMQKNMDLLKQARTDLAAPLAKELGVNPTDRDFQATLDRIFDSNASQESRSAQIDALEQRILARKTARGSSKTQRTDSDPLGIR
jgi:hypothetical protein